MNHPSNEPGPPTLVRGAQSPTIIAVKELVEPEIVLPVLVKVQQVATPVDATATIISASEQVLQPMLDLLRYATQMHLVTGTHRAFYLQALPEEEIEALERLHEEEVDAQPDRPSPVTVAAEQPAVRVSRYVPDAEGLAVDVHGIGMVFVVLG